MVWSGNMWYITLNTRVGLDRRSMVMAERVHRGSATGTVGAGRRVPVRAIATANNSPA